MTDTSRDAEELLARTICEALGLDPDDELECGPTEQADGNGGRIDSAGTRAGTNPWRYRWRRFQAPARAVLALQPALLPALRAEIATARAALAQSAGGN